MIPAASAAASPSCHAFEMANAVNINTRNVTILTRGSRVPNGPLPSVSSAPSASSVSSAPPPCTPSASGYPPPSTISWRCRSDCDASALRWLASAWSGRVRGGCPMVMIRAPIAAASATECVMTSTVTPWARSVRMRSWIRALARASNPAVGSSMMSTSGRQARTPAMAASRCWPPDRAKGERSARWPIRSSRNAHSTCSRTAASSNP